MILAVALLGLFPPSTPRVCQESPNDFGISEKVGGKIPLDLVFRDEAGKEVRLREIVDRPTVLTLVYYKCPGICTPVLDGAARAVDQVKAKPGVDFRALTVSFDPREGPDLAARKRRAYLKSLTRPFPPLAWRFLTGDKASIQKLTAAVGFEYKPEGNEFRHAAAVVILTPQGVVSRYMYGTNYLPVNLEMALAQAARGETSPTIPKAVAYCFTEDPKGKLLTMKVLSTAGAVLLGLTLCLFVGLLIRRGARGKEDGSAQEDLSSEGPAKEEGG